MLLICEGQEKLRLGPWIQTISVCDFNNNGGREGRKGEGGAGRHQGTINLSCTLVPKDAAASLSTCCSCQIHWSNVCYNNIFQRAAVQDCCCLPKQDSKSLEQYHSHLGSSPNRQTNQSPLQNYHPEKQSMCPKFWGFLYLFSCFDDARYGRWFWNSKLYVGWD